MSKAIALARKRKKLQANTGVDPSMPKFEIDKFLFKEQLDFVRDPSPFKTAVCSRRSGKTTACAAHLIDTALNDSAVVALYVTLSRALAKKIIWPELRRINKTYGLNGVENKSELSITFPNGSCIYLAGAGTLDQVAHFRGMALKTCYIDEAQSFRAHLRELVDDVFGPALMDHDGSMMLIGTPATIPAGFFYECSVESQEWAHHAWTFFQNPFIATKSKRTHQELLDRELRRRGVPVSDPSIQREWFGRWEKDDESLLLHYDRFKNDFQELPSGKYNYILGIDIGYNDADSLSVLAWSDSSAVTYLVEEIVTERQTNDQLVTQIDYLNKKYPFSKMVADPGGGGKKLIESIKQRYSVPLEPADKLGKIANYRILDDALRSGKFKAKTNSKFAEDCNLLEKDQNKSTPDKIVVAGHSDAVDSVLYAFKESPAYVYTEPEIAPQPGSSEYDKYMAETIWSHQAKIQKENNKDTTWETDRNGVPSWLKFQE